MTHILQINASLFGPKGQSTRLADRFVQRFRSLYPDATLTVRELAADAIGHLDADTFGAFTTPPDERTAAQKRRVRFSDELIAELQAADLVVIGVPMYNFGVPSTLKAWFDHVARAGVTFQYTDNGPRGLLAGKRAVLAHARGGRYAEGVEDHQVPWLRQVLGFLGIGDVEMVHAEGLAIDDPDTILPEAHERIDRLAATI